MVITKCSWGWKNLDLKDEPCQQMIEILEQTRNIKNKISTFILENIIKITDEKP